MKSQEIEINSSVNRMISYIMQSIGTRDYGVLGRLLKIRKNTLIDYVYRGKAPDYKNQRIIEDFYDKLKKKLRVFAIVDTKTVISKTGQPILLKLGKLNTYRDQFVIGEKIKRGTVVSGSHHVFKDTEKAMKAWDRFPDYRGKLTIHVKEKQG